VRRVEELVEWLRDPKNVLFLSLAIAIYDSVMFGDEEWVEVSKVFEKLFAPRENVERALRVLCEKGIAMVREGRVTLTPLGIEVVERARWGKVLTPSWERRDRSIRSTA